jgi:hypothetical protein
MLKKTDTVALLAEQAVEHLSFVAGVLYKCKAHARFQYVIPVNTGDFFVCNCIPCDKNGNPVKGYESGVPVWNSDLSEPIFED